MSINGRMKSAVVGLLTSVALAAGVAAAPPQAVAATRPLVAVIGDSYVAGWTAETRNAGDAWYNVTAGDLGWAVGNVVANPAAGYLQPGDYGTFADALRAHPIAPWTDYVLVQGGLNDASQDPNRVPGAVADLLTVIRQQAPNAVPIVIGAFAPVPDRSYGPTQVTVARRIGDWQAIGDTRYTIGFMCGFQVSSDLVHPTLFGHRQIGDWVAWHVAHGLDNGTPLHLDPTGSSYTV